MEFARTFDEQKLTMVFEEMVTESGLDTSATRIEFRDDEPLAGPDIINKRKKLKAEHPDLSIYLSVYLHSVQKTIIQGNLPLDTYDGTSNFNFMKELIYRYCTGKKNNVFRTLILSGFVEDKLNAHGGYLTFFCHLFLSGILNVFCDTWYEVLKYFNQIQRTDATVFLSFDEAETREVLNHAKAFDKPYSLFVYAMLAAYARVRPEVTQMDPSTMALCQPISLQKESYAGDGNAVGDWLLVRSTLVCPAAFTVDDAKALRQSLHEEIASMSGNVRLAGLNRAFARDTSGWFSQFATSSAQSHMTPFNFWMNNYGQREVHPDAELVSWHWPAAFGAIAFNIINVNDRLCLSLASRYLPAEDLQGVSCTIRSILLGAADGRFAHAPSL